MVVVTRKTYRNVSLVVEVDQLCDQVARPVTVTADVPAAAAAAPTPAPVQRPTPVQQLADDLAALCAIKTSANDVVHREYQLLSHLLHHLYPLTLLEVEAIVPALARFRGIVNKVTTNVGHFYHARAGASETDLEEILMHIVANDEYLLNRTKAQLKRFKLEWEKQFRTPKQQGQINQREQAIRRTKVAEQERMEQHRRSTIPAEYREEKSHMVPMGWTCVADIITEVDQMDWSKVENVQKAAINSRAFLTPKSRKYPHLALKPKPKPTVDVVSATPPMGDPDKGLRKGDFSPTRLHNGPGLTDVKKAKGRLPVAEIGRAGVTESGCLDAVERSEEEVVSSWAQTRELDVELFVEEESKKAVVKMQRG
jgi:hypothetical protein